MASRSDIAVSVRGLGKSYTIAHNEEKHNTLAETILARLKNPFGRPAKETFWALEDVSFEIKRGDVVGIIGRNGAGKSTLLKVLSRITEPTKGEIDIYGRVGSLLEVGTGFHPELTGRENVFLNGAILGMNKAEIRKQFDAIVDFAGVEQFLDTPVKRYSSGMYVRLAFAVAAHLNLEILIVDEVLAVGDTKFQSKCLGKMSDVTKQGRTVLFVSHNMGAVGAICQRGIMLEGGRVVTSGAVRSVIGTYMSSATVSGSAVVHSDQHIKGDQAVSIQELLLTTPNGEPRSEFQVWEPMDLYLRFRTDGDVLAASFWVLITGADGQVVMSGFQKDQYGETKFQSGIDAIRVRIDANLLTPGQYVISAGAFGQHHEFYDWVEHVLAFRVGDGIHGVGRFDGRLGMVTNQWEWKPCCLSDELQSTPPAFHGTRESAVQIG